MSVCNVAHACIYVIFLDNSFEGETDIKEKVYGSGIDS